MAGLFLDQLLLAQWTFGLEAFGPKTQFLDVLRAGVATITAQAELPALPAAWTSSYASWLLAWPGAAIATVGMGFA